MYIYNPNLGIVNAEGGRTKFKVMLSYIMGLGHTKLYET